MQIYAYDENGIEIIAHSAERNQKYYCPDCHQRLSFRMSPYIRAHFFHLKDQNPCHRTAKSLTHLEVQSYLIEKLPEGEARMEKFFPTIKRRADVCWEKEKIIFEVQISFITQEEVEARICDYRSCGYEVVFILHLQRFSRYMTTAAELFLRHHTHYYTNINPEGYGGLFDQFNVLVAGKREACLFRKQVCITKPLREWRIDHLPERMAYYRKNWRLSFDGDLLNTRHLGREHLQKLAELEQLFIKQESKPTWKRSIRKRVQDFFRLVGYVLLDSI